MIYAHCHCRAIILEISAQPRFLKECGCKTCRPYGAIWAHYRPQEVRFIQTPGASNSYPLGDGTIMIRHCKICGCTIDLESGGEMRTSWVAVNARLFEPDDIVGLPVKTPTLSCHAESASF